MTEQKSSEKPAPSASTKTPPTPKDTPRVTKRQMENLVKAQEEAARLMGFDV